METADAVTAASASTTEVIRVDGLTYTYPKAAGAGGARHGFHRRPRRDLRVSRVPAARQVHHAEGAHRSAARSRRAGRGVGQGPAGLGIRLLPAHRRLLRAAESLPETHGPGEPAVLRLALRRRNGWIRWSCSTPSAWPTTPTSRVGKYSKGMQMRLTFARALINDPELLFLDEPTSGLDPVNARKVKNIDLGPEGARPHDLSDDARHGDGRRAVRPGGLRRRRQDRRAGHTRRAEDRPQPARWCAWSIAATSGATGERRVSDGRPGRRSGIPRGAAGPPRRDHPQQGSQPRRRVRRGHRKAADRDTAGKRASARADACRSGSGSCTRRCSPG